MMTINTPKKPMAPLTDKEKRSHKKVNTVTSVKLKLAMMKTKKDTKSIAK